MFCAVFSVSEKRLNNINKQTVQGNIPKENRGGDRKFQKYVNKKEALRQFLNSLPAKESHYGRQKSKRIYLSSELNCKKLLKFYNDSVAPELQVKKTLFYTVFHKEYNIGFSSPSSDACSVCLLWAYKIKMEKDPAKKQVLMTELRVHKLRSKAFYNHMKEDVPNAVSLCFDLQQVLPLPRTPIQDAFYSRQISVYNFCIVYLDSKNPCFYSWDETIGKRGSTEIASALYHYLSSMNFENHVEIIRLFCDGCGGQNKNNHVLQTLIQWLFSKSPLHVKAIHLYFPVRGHSFLPADRVFGRLEKEIRKETIITTRDGYDNILKRHGNLKLLRQDWQLLDIKDLKENFNNLEGLQKMKRIKIEKKIKRGKVIGCNIKAFVNYRFECNEDVQTLLKRGKRIPSEIPTAVIENKELSENKKKDVNNLLTKQFGNQWTDIQELAWYKNIVKSCRPASNTDSENPDESLCDCLDHDVGELRI